MLPMNSLVHLMTILLSAMGLTILVVWPQSGPTAWLRERALRPLLAGRAAEVLDCYICLGFWAGLVVSPVWWKFCCEPWCWAACLMTPAAFWIVLERRTT